MKPRQRYVCWSCKRSEDGPFACKCSSPDVIPELAGARGYRDHHEPRARWLALVTLAALGCGSAATVGEPAPAPVPTQAPGPTQAPPPVTEPAPTVAATPPPAPTPDAGHAEAAAPPPLWPPNGNTCILAPNAYGVVRANCQDTAGFYVTDPAHTVKITYAGGTATDFCSNRSPSCPSGWTCEYWTQIVAGNEVRTAGLAGVCP